MILEQYITVASVILIFMCALFLLSVIVKRNDIADVAWGTGIFLVGLVSYIYGPQSDYTLLLTVLGGLWGVRLTTRIFLRNIKKGEDPRYKKWRDSWGKWFYVRSFFQVYLLQGFLMTMVGYSFIHASIYSEGFQIGTLALVGSAVWLIGYFFEVVGDYQLDKFLKNPANKGKIMNQGLWKYSRHPNYFGEVTMWWGIWLMVSMFPLSYIALISPLTITFLIFRVSGIPMLEESMAKNPSFQTYKEKTSVFFPLPPKKIV